MVQGTSLFVLCMEKVIKLYSLCFQSQSLLHTHTSTLPGWYHNFFSLTQLSLSLSLPLLFLWSNSLFFCTKSFHFSSVIIHTLFSFLSFSLLFFFLYGSLTQGRIQHSLKFSLCWSPAVLQFVWRLVVSSGIANYSLSKWPNFLSLVTDVAAMYEVCVFKLVWLE